MAKKSTIAELRQQLTEALANNDRDTARRLKARIRSRERAEVYASLGLKRVRGALGGIYYE